MQFWDWYGDGSTYLVDIGLACCTLEFEAAANGRRRASTRSIEDLPPGVRVVVVVSGTVTDRLTDAVVTCISRIRSAAPAARVVAFGACASAGGPYWDSYAVTKGIDQLVEVDAYVPGCPPPPAALAGVVDELSGLSERSRG
ncbi:proton-conducting membrane transporter [Microlunatus sp. Gsoil 973]|jgi:NADH-quinone oxidoreductase subunit B|uniref:NADH-quinone oxidoreductase subunit B family protein n=1 Tax=Microlunatus sp. Gsoil 973 TaxID=2672569 RepID=UPI0012B4A3CD|nr:proton-conducting membrane transporter [Microlunatus sp. Gsoil 973]QGN35758.1 proton-conducting membrane transporter [Microlunatus sp. Gsoil 973]